MNRFEVAHWTGDPWLRLTWAFIAVLGLVGLPAKATELVTLELETQALDLDTGAVLTAAREDLSMAAGADIKFAYHADRSPHAVVVPAGEGVDIAVVANTGFDGVTSADVDKLTFTSQATDIPFSTNDCIVIRTDQGDLYKIGNPIESGMSVTFNFAVL